MRGFLFLLAAIASVAGTGALHAGNGERSWPLTLRAQMLRLGEVDWRMRIAAAGQCPGLAAGTGIWIDSATAYSVRDEEELSRALQMGRLPQIASIASGSPAALAGLRPGDEILAIGDIAMADALARSPDPAGFSDAVTDMLAALPRGRATSLLLRRGKAILRKQVVPVPVCAGRTVLDDEPSLGAHGDASDISVTSALVDFTANDHELALVIGHELAHLLLRDDAATPPADQPRIEERADIAGARLAHCAGYDVALAAAFWPRYRAQDAQSRQRLPTHPSPERREMALRAAAPGLSCPVTLP